MFDNLSPSAGLTALAILCLAAIVGGIMFAQMMAWAPIWEAWLEAPPPHGSGLGNAYVKAFKPLPVYMVLAEILVIIAMASPIDNARRR